MSHVPPRHDVCALYPLHFKVEYHANVNQRLMHLTMKKLPTLVCF